MKDGLKTTLEARGLKKHFNLKEGMLSSSKVLRAVDGVDFTVKENSVFSLVGESGCVWYAGTPEPTDYNEVKPGFGLVATINEEGVITKEVNIGRWNFIERKQVDLNTKEDIEALRNWLENLEDKERTVVKLRLIGALSLSPHSELEELLFHFQDILGAVETRMNNLVVIPEDADFMDLGFSGFASRTVERLRSNIEESGSDTITSRDALALLVRLAGREL